jgi:3-hydroxyacyl-CoA dehydrogenase
MAQVGTVGIVGRGIIGSSWALVFARAGLKVRIWCRKDEQAAETLSTIAASIRSLKGTGLEGDAGTLPRVSAHASLADALVGAKFVQESVAENLALKHQILREIEACTPADTIIGSSTSGIIPSRLAPALAHPDRFLVVHPITPPHLLPITELCAGPQTSESVVAQVRELMTSIGQHPVVLRTEIQGFALNRILGAMMNECFALIRDGVLEPGDVDPLLTEGFGLRWGVIGPLAAMDLNAPDGIGDYLRRYGSIFNLVATSRGAAPVLDEALIEHTASALQSRFAGQERSARIASRDGTIALLRSARDCILREGRRPDPRSET